MNLPCRVDVLTKPEPNRRRASSHMDLSCNQDPRSIRVGLEFEQVPDRQFLYCGVWIGITIGWNSSHMVRNQLRWLKLIGKWSRVVLGLVTQASNYVKNNFSSNLSMGLYLQRCNGAWKSMTSSLGLAQCGGGNFWCCLWHKIKIQRRMCHLTWNLQWF